MNQVGKILFDSPTLLEIRDNFLKELTQAEKGQKTSFPFIRHTLPKSSLLTKGEIFQAMVIGASVFQKALVKKQNNQIEILERKEAILPQFHTKKDLFSFFQKHLQGTVSKVALNFGYDLQPISRDGVLDGEKTSRGSKENAFKGLLGKVVGYELEKYIFAQTKRKIRVSVANDTICLLLSGLGFARPESLASYIVGSGINGAFFLSDTTVVNLESGNFSGFIQTKTGKIIDQNSVFVGTYLFEKETSGLYLYQHYNLVTRPTSPLSSTKELYDVARSGKGVESKIAQKIFERSASLAAAQIAGIYMFKKQSHMTFVMEGSVYWKGYNYKEHVGNYLRLLQIPEDGITFIAVKNSAILGAARLLTSQNVDEMVGSWLNEYMSSTLPELIDQFLEYLYIEKNCSKLTIRDYKHYLDIFSQWFTRAQPHKTISDIDLAIVRRYRLYLANRVDEKGLTLKRVTQNYYVIALRSFLRYLIKNDIKTLEPSKIDLPKTESRSLKFLEREHIERLVTAVDTSKEEGIRDRAVLELLFSTGLRVSELVSLNHNQINLDRKEFGVIGKGRKSRIVFVSDRAAEWLGRYLEVREDKYKPLFIRYSGRKSEENNGEKMRLTARSIERIVKKYVAIARLPVDASVHTLRHSFATDLLTNGADLRSVQEMLGHKNISTTQIYTHITNKQLREVHEAFHSGNK